VSTFVEGLLIRAVGPDSFLDITGPDVAVTSFDGGVTFDADLNAEQIAAVRARMASRDDADQAARAHLSDLRTAASAADLTTPDGLEALRALLTAEADYLLGDA